MQDSSIVDAQVSADGLSGRGAAAGPPLPLSFTPAQPPSPGAPPLSHLIN